MYLLAFLVLLLSPIVYSTPQKCPRPGSNAQFEVYDFIVVGLGTTGAIIASRLSENPDFCVLGLEQGPENLVPNLYAPGNFFVPTPYDFTSPHDANLWSSPQNGQNGRQLSWKLRRIGRKDFYKRSRRNSTQ